MQVGNTINKQKEKSELRHRDIDEHTGLNLRHTVNQFIFSAINY